MKTLLRGWRLRMSQILGHAIARTAAVNMISVGVTTLTGILLARALGESGRGMYAAVVAWFGVALVVGELGQSAAVTYFVARLPGSAKLAIRRGRLVMSGASFAVVIAGVSASTALAGGDVELAQAYVVVFSGVGLNALLAPYVYALQALSLRLWNIVRLTQPLVNFIAILVWYMLAPLSVLGASVCLFAGYATQLAVARVLGRRSIRASALVDPLRASDLLRFGVKQASSAIPQSLATSLDRLALSQAGSPAELGQYAVAQSVVGAAAPLGTAISSVLFPRLSAFQGSHRERRKIEVRMLIRSSVSMVSAVTVLVVISPWAVPFVFGEAFFPATELAIWAAPAVVTQSLLGVATAFLRGRGTPGRASLVYLLTLALTAVSMSVLVPVMGARGAAVGSFVGSACGFLLAIFFLRWSDSVRPMVGDRVESVPDGGKDGPSRSHDRPRRRASSKSKPCPRIP